MNVVMIFLDGVGIGSDDPDVNPFARLALPCLDALLTPPDATEARVLKPIDANLDMDGLPQSGTGQASLFTGLNCAQVAGRHFGPFPHSATKDVLARHNIFRQVSAVAGMPESAAFANAYPPPFFKSVERRNRWTVTTLCCMDAGVRIRDLEDLAVGNALAADITGIRLADAGFPVKPVSERMAADALASLADHYRFILFEYFLTDKAGHSQSFENARTVLESLDGFLACLLEAIDERAQTTLVISSDHGNLEDLSTRSHTRNPVPLIVVGAGAHRFADTDSITDITPAIIKLLGE